MESGRIKKLAFGGTLILGTILPACGVPDEVAGADIGATQRDTTSGTSGSGSGSGSGTSNPCWPNTDCTPQCNVDCGTPPATCAHGHKMSGWMQTYKTLTLLATKYAVNGSTCGPVTLGHHTGLAVQSSSRTTVWNLACDTGLTSTMSHETPSIVNIIFDHGRTYDSNANSPVESFTWDTGTGQPAEYEQALHLCTQYFTDYEGFCDSVCGNDAYTLPSGTQWTGPISGNRKFANRIKYGGGTGGSNAYWAGAFSSVWQAVFGSTNIDVPLYGHNSNNDANATFAMFGACRKFKSWLDGNCNALADPNLGCAPNWSQIKSQVNLQVRQVCMSSCGGFQYANGTYVLPAGVTAPDLDIAAPDSNINAAASSRTVCGAIQPWSGNYLEGPWPNGQFVQGM